MDSRDIYNQTRREIEWEDKWIHIGTGNKIDKDLVKHLITEQFKGQLTIMLKRGRRNSQTVQTNQIIDTIMKLIGKENFELWDEVFSKAIKFDKIGVIIHSKYAI